MAIFAGQAWFWLAVTAAVLWGLCYTLDEQLMKFGLSPAFVMFMQSVIILPLYLLFALKFNDFRGEWQMLTGSKTMILYLLICGICIMGGSLMIMYGVAMKNASLVSLIEISYPIFVVLFARALFGEVEVNYWTAFGGLLILFGVGVIYLKS